MFEGIRQKGAQLKLAKNLAKEKIEVEAGDGAVKVEANAAMQITKVMLDEAKVKNAEPGQLEKWLESAFNQVIRRSVEAMAEVAKQSGFDGGGGLPR